jgi:hypothetical protein
VNLVRVPVSSTDLILQAETELLTAIARLLAGGNVASADWKIDRLKRLGALNEQALRIILRYRNAILEGVDAEVERKAFEGLQAQEKLFQTAKDDGALLKGVLPFEADPALEAVVQVWQKQGREGLSKSMAAMLQNVGQVYVDTVNRTSLQVLTGGMSAREALVTTVKEWAAAGIPSITDKAGRQWSTEAYASMVLRSTSARVVAETQITRAQQYGADLIEVSSHLGARPLCAPYQGHIFSLSGTHPKYPPFSSTSYGEPAGLFGINCVLGETLVSGPRKRAAYRRKYSGEIIVIRTAGGNELSVTPNHPILTDKGWVNAGLLVEGGNVVCRAALNGEVGTGPNPDHDVTRIEDLFDSLLETGDVLEFPASAGYFHGDVSDSEVEVVLPEGLLRDDFKASLLQHRSENLLSLASESPDFLTSHGRPGQALEAPGATPDGIMGRFGIPGAPLETTSLTNDPRGLGPVLSQGNAEFFEVPSDGTLRDPDLRRNRALPHAGVVHLEEVSRGEAGLDLESAPPVSSGGVHPSPLEAVDDGMQGASVLDLDFLGGLTGAVKLDHIVLIERKPAQSSFVHVYNLETEYGWYYANNIITHNCGHRQYPFFEGMSRQTYEPYDSEENDAAYKESQVQRSLERSIRAAKREADMLDALKEPRAAEQAREQVRARQEAMRAFIEKTGRTRRRDREQIIS